MSLSLEMTRYKQLTIDFSGTWKPESERHIGETQQELGEGQGEAAPAQ